MIQRNVEFTDEQPSYRYLIQKNGLVEIYIYKKISESEDEEKNKTYLYDLNIFKANPEEFTEEMIASNPEEWLEYQTVEYTDKERIDALEDAVNALIMGDIEV